ncbi:MAG: Glycosyl transferase group 1 [Parcubacteria group bacterium GW2011_GWA1_47_8]|nr:MAG: Glycosyl transferase group 1 [Parcubacteria group bacterium GW2011_GWA1_47_8]
MKILSVSSDRTVFEQGSAVRSRILEYGRLVDEFRIIVFAKKSLGFVETSFPPNIFLYPTKSRSKWGYIPGALKCAARMKVKGVRVDVVTAQDPFESGIAAFLLARIFQAKLHLQIHTDLFSPHFREESFMNRIRVRVAKFLIPRADAIRVVSKRIEDSLSKVKSQKSKVSVLPIFVDTKAIEEVPITTDLKKKYSELDMHILMASRLSPEKNIPLAISAMKGIVARYPKAGLIVVGEGTEESRLKEFAGQVGLSEHIIFEGWKKDLVSYLKTADVFLLTSNYEGYGMTIIEALAAGCPVVMTDVGCAGEVVREGENGLIVPVGDREKLERALAQFISGEVKLEASLPRLLTKEEYLAAYKKSWEDVLR